MFNLGYTRVALKVPTKTSDCSSPEVLLEAKPEKIGADRRLGLFS